MAKTRIRFVGEPGEVYHYLKLGPVDNPDPPEREFQGGDVVWVQIRPTKGKPDCVDLKFDDGQYEYYRGNLRAGLSTRCRDCARTHPRRTHGQSHTSEWAVWIRIKNSGECCKCWLVFSHFLADVGPRPSAEHAFRRVNQRRRFTPKNAGWVLPNETTWPETGKFVTYNGKRQNLSAWARELGVSPQALHKRIQWHGLIRALARDFKRGSTA